jgi:hypothetical protein
MQKRSASGHDRDSGAISCRVFPFPAACR